MLLTGFESCVYVARFAIMLLIMTMNGFVGLAIMGGVAVGYLLASQVQDRLQIVHD